MNPSFGTRLRQQREQRAVSLDAIAADTKIKLSLLEALERDDVSQWPVGIFRRAYIRSYAQAIGVDPAEVVREFLELYPDPSEVVPAAPEGESESSQSSPNRLRRLVTSAIAAVPALQHAQRRSSGAAVTTGAAREYVVRGSGDVEAAGRVTPVAAEPEVSGAESSAATAAPPPEQTAHLEGEFELLPPPVEVEAARPVTEPGLSDAARLCTRLARVVHRHDLTPVLEDAAAILDAVGLIVWSWDARASALRPSLTHGYPDSVLARLPVVRSDADNAIAAAYRSSEACVVNGDGDVSGAAVIPMMGPEGCVAVLAIELRHGGEQRESVRAMATVLAAQLVTLLGSEPVAEAASA
jgi:transcriptional regulator with XRE-family HTH domain